MKKLPSIRIAKNYSVHALNLNVSSLPRNPLSNPRFLSLLLVKDGQSIGTIAIVGGQIVSRLVCDSTPAEVVQRFDTLAEAVRVGRIGVEWSYPTSTNANRFNSGKGFWCLEGPIGDDNGPACLGVMSSEEDARTLAQALS